MPTEGDSNCRPLEVTSSEDTIEGETNYLTVDRDNVLATIFAELQ